MPTLWNREISHIWHFYKQYIPDHTWNTYILRKYLINHMWVHSVQWMSKSLGQMHLMNYNSYYWIWYSCFIIQNVCFLKLDTLVLWNHAPKICILSCISLTPGQCSPAWVMDSNRAQSNQNILLIINSVVGTAGQCLFTLIIFPDNIAIPGRAYVAHPLLQSPHAHKITYTDTSLMFRELPEMSHEISSKIYIQLFIKILKSPSSEWRIFLYILYIFHKPLWNERKISLKPLWNWSHVWNQ